MPTRWAPGPYVLEEFRPNELISLRKNPTSSPPTSGSLVASTSCTSPRGAATTTALLAGQLDDAQFTTADSQAVEAATTSSRCSGRSPSSPTMTFNFCSTQPPVRQRAGAQGRPAGHRPRGHQPGCWLQGAGQPAYGFWPQDHANFADDLVETTALRPRRGQAADGRVRRDRRVDRALLPGQPGLGAAGRPPPGASSAPSASTPRSCRRRRSSTSSSTPRSPGRCSCPGRVPASTRCSRSSGPASSRTCATPTGPRSTTWPARSRRCRRTTPRPPELWKDIDREIAEHAYVVFLVQSPNFTALNRDRVGGELFVSPTRSPASFQSYENLYIKA